MILREIECLKGATFLGGEMIFFCFTECPKCHIENSICQLFLIGLDLFCSFLWSIDLKKKGWKISLFVLYLVTYPCVFMFFFRPKCSKYVVVHGCGFKKNWGWENDGWKTQPCALMTRAMSILSRWKMHLDVDDILVFASNDTISIGLDSLDLDPKIYQIQMFICLLFSNTHHSRSRHSFCEVAVGRPSFCLWGLTFFQSQNEKWRINLKVPSKLQPADSHPSWVINLHTPKN